MEREWLDQINASTRGVRLVKDNEEDRCPKAPKTEPENRSIECSNRQRWAVQDAQAFIVALLVYCTEKDLTLPGYCRGTLYHNKRPDPIEFLSSGH